ncbi:hypothetical protein GCM10009706_26960 [Curtobacterium citreum]|nr:hypothetical protein GCM10009706_26960 [Curtobacterium citreum]
MDEDTGQDREGRALWEELHREGDGFGEDVPVDLELHSWDPCRSVGLSGRPIVAQREERRISCHPAVHKVGPSNQIVNQDQWC